MKWVDATDLAQWADRLDARACLPDLVRRLIGATATPTRLEFPSGESVQNPGWDGIVESYEGSQFVPVGRSGWECGCDRRVKQKADGDFGKRVTDPTPLDPGASSFVFVTPRHWLKKRVWVEKQQALGKWKEVRALDADDLEQWLERAPAVGAWLSRRMGKVDAAVIALDDWWFDWSGMTNPRLTAGVMIAGRADAFQAARDWLNGPPGTMAVEADSAEEAAAFLAATISELPTAEAEYWWSRALCLGQSPLAGNLGTGSLRGVQTRALDDGGSQERLLSARYRGWAAACSNEWPRTSAALTRVADSYEAHGKFHDTRSEQFDW